ncbi:hypothetical protein JM16_004925 [Phytophthora kernoviae]|uniref:START domain-containing protein n=1 Tax=Phytophthora kernoviae TaxID=325452 RepID=A0A8T0LU68_9STRA|nr:hypothetical protein JM16_004925 [Phytophthora kernoviae]
MEGRDSEGFARTTWTTNPMPPAELSAEQQEKYRSLATQLLANTLRDYDIYSADPRQRRMSRRRWKPVKTRDHITVYKERYPTPSTLTSSNQTPPQTGRISFADRVSMAIRGGGEWTEPKLLVATGWVDGTLDDLMYGVASPDARSMLLKATVVKNTLINGAVLNCIDAPCDVDPFRFLAADIARAEVQAGCFSTASMPASSHKSMASFASTGVTTDTDMQIDSFRGMKVTPEEIPDQAEEVLSVRDRREQIWSQMVELRMVAESIYKLTLETTESLNNGSRMAPQS